MMKGSATEGMCTLPQDFIKRRFGGLSLEDHCEQGSRWKGDGGQGLCNGCMGICMLGLVRVCVLRFFLRLQNSLSRGGLWLLLRCWSKMKDMCSSGEGRGAWDIPYRLLHVAFGICIDIWCVSLVLSIQQDVVCSSKYQNSLLTKTKSVISKPHLQWNVFDKQPNHSTDFDTFQRTAKKRNK